MIDTTPQWALALVAGAAWTLWAVVEWKARRRG